MSAFSVGFVRSSNSLIDIAATNELIEDSVSIFSSVRKFSRVLANQGVTVLLFSSNDCNKRLPEKILHSALPKNLQSIRDGFSVRNNCPVVEAAMSSGKRFSLYSNATAKNITTDEERYLEGVTALEFTDIGVIPVGKNGLMHMLVVGLEGQKFDGTVSGTIGDRFQAFVIAAMARFPDLGFFSNITRQVAQPEDRRNRLSEKEVECVFWTANGKTSYEISQILALSEHTVNHYIGSACKKLGATNRAHAIVKALKLELFDLAPLH